MIVLSKIPTVLAIHDMSGFGRCALTVVVPVLSSFGIQAVPVPTAVLSTHTGGFTGFASVDLTEYMSGTLRHYKTLGLDFDCIYSGYLANAQQAEIVRSFIGAFGTGKRVVVDPAFADDGELYSTVTDELVDGMRGLVSSAEIITPNYTEASMILKRGIKQSLTEEEAVSLGQDLLGLGCNTAVVTGVPSGEKILTAVVSKTENEIISQKRIHVSYPGCGDLFASAMTGSIMQGRGIVDSVCFSAELVEKSIIEAEKLGDPVRNGLPFEKFLKKF